MNDSGTAPTGLATIKELFVMLGLGALVYLGVFALRAIVFVLVDIPELFKSQRA
jgi:hypothetical protein